MILPCICRHEMQDELHGRGNRVFNRLPDPAQGVQEYRCTVCLREVRRGGGARTPAAQSDAPKTKERKSR